jgi:hypothetical protein
LKQKINDRCLYAELRAIRDRCSKLTVLDTRTPDQVLGYDERGLHPGLLKHPTRTDVDPVDLPRE